MSSRNSRRRFLLHGILGFMFGSFIFTPNRSAATKKSAPRYFLTREGKLVYVEETKVPKSRKRVSMEDLKNWVLRNNRIKL